jgi:hypothetical protein
MYNTGHGVWVDLERRSSWVVAAGFGPGPKHKISLRSAALCGITGGSNWDVDDGSSSGCRESLRVELVRVDYELMRTLAIKGARARAMATSGGRRSRKEINQFYSAERIHTFMVAHLL